MTFPASLPFFYSFRHCARSLASRRTQSDQANPTRPAAVAQQESRGGARATSNDVAVMEMGGSGERRTEEEAAATWACGAVAALGLAGAGVLVWWAVAFHPAHEQLWMVPVGLVLLGTPLVTWLSLFASGACRRLGRLRAGADQPHLAPEK